MENSGDKAPATQRQDWQVILWASFFAQVLSIMGFSASLPFIPLFLVKDLHVATVEEAGLWAGVMAASSSIIMAFVAPVWGALGDRFGRKSMVLRAMIGGCVLIALMAISNSVWMLLILRILQGTVTGTVPANIALVSSVSPKNRQGYALGVIQTAVFLGASIGPLVGGSLADLTDYRFSFVVTSVALGVAALVVALFVHENFTPVRRNPAVAKTSWAGGMKLALAQKEFMAVLIITTMIQFGSNVVAPVLALFIKTLNGTEEGAATLAGLELAVTGIASAASAVVGGNLSDRFGYRRVLVISAVAAALLYFPQAFVTNVWQLLILRGAMGLFFGGIMPAAGAIIAQLIPEERKGMAYGLSSSFSSIGFGLGPITGATIAAIINTRAVFIVTGFILLLTAFRVYVVLGARARAAVPEETVTGAEQIEIEQKR